MQGGVPSILFVSKENAVRSLMAESCMLKLGQGRFQPFSCGEPGSMPEQMPPAVREVLQRAALPVEGLSPKGWNEFARFGPSQMDFVITLDASVLQSQPRWPGQPVQALWDLPRVETRQGSALEIRSQLLHTLHALHRRLDLLVNLHSRVRSHRDLQDDLRDLGRT